MKKGKPFERKPFEGPLYIPGEERPKKRKEGLDTQKGTISLLKERIEKWIEAHRVPDGMIYSPPEVLDIQHQIKLVLEQCSAIDQKVVESYRQQIEKRLNRLRKNIQACLKILETLQTRINKTRKQDADFCLAQLTEQERRGRSLPEEVKIIPPPELQEMIDLQTRLKKALKDDHVLLEIAQEEFYQRFLGKKPKDLEPLEPQQTGADTFYHIRTPNFERYISMPQIKIERTAVVNEPLANFLSDLREIRKARNQWLEDLVRLKIVINTLKAKIQE